MLHRAESGAGVSAVPTDEGQGTNFKHHATRSAGIKKSQAIPDTRLVEGATEVAWRERPTEARPGAISLDRPAQRADRHREALGLAGGVAAAEPSSCRLRLGFEVDPGLGADALRVGRAVAVRRLR